MSIRRKERLLKQSSVVTLQGQVPVSSRKSSDNLTALRLNLNADFLRLTAQQNISNPPSFEIRPASDKVHGLEFLEKKSSTYSSVSILAEGSSLQAKNKIIWITNVLDNADVDLVRMDVRDWSISLRIFAVISQLLPTITKLTTLQLWNCGLTAASIQMLAESLPHTSIREIVLDGNPISEENFFLLLKSELQMLSLRFCSLTDEGCRRLAEAIGSLPPLVVTDAVQPRINASLQCLNLSFNGITEKGCVALAKALRLNKTLTNLSLAYNSIGDAGAQAILSVLARFHLNQDEVMARRCFLLNSITLTAREEQARSSKQLQVEEKQRNKLASSISRKDKTEQQKSSRSIRDETRSLKMKSKTNLHSSFADLIGKARSKYRDLNFPSHPLVDDVESKDGKLWSIGNLALSRLDLTGTDMTEESLQLVHSVLLYQKTLELVKRGLKKVGLERNGFDADDLLLLEVKALLNG